MKRRTPSPDLPIALATVIVAALTVSFVTLLLIIAKH